MNQKNVLEIILFKLFIDEFLKERPREVTGEEKGFWKKYTTLFKEVSAYQYIIELKSKEINGEIVDNKDEPDNLHPERHSKFIKDMLKKDSEEIGKLYLKKISEFQIFLVEYMQRYDKEIPKEILDAVYRTNNENQLTLFANIPEEGYFQTSKYYMDAFDKMIPLVDEERQRIARNFTPEVRAGKDRLSFKLDLNDKTTELDIISQVDQLLKVIRNPKHKLYYYALWNFARKRNSREFRGVKVSDIIKIAKPGKTVQYKDKLEFTEFLEAYSMLRMEKTVNTKIIKGKKHDKLIEDVDSINFFNITHKRYVTVRDKKGEKINARTLYKIYGELPKDPYNVGYHIPDTIFQLDGNQPERIAFFLELYRLKNQRFNYPDEPVRKTRFDLIRLAGLEKTDSQNKTRANEKLLETLELGHNLKIINGYPAKLPLDDNEIIEIYLFYPQNSSTKLPKMFN